MVTQKCTRPRGGFHDISHVMRIVVMGVSGSGKSVVGRALADRLAVPFCDGDDLHPAINTAKMAAGEPLDDADRAPWLDRIAAWMRERSDGVMACSALKRRYRDRLRDAVPGACFVFLNVPRAVLERRLTRRAGHFMPPALLASQIDALERPRDEPNVIAVTNVESVDDSIADILKQLAG